MQPDYEEEQKKELDRQAAEVINDQTQPNTAYPLYAPVCISIIPALFIAHLFKGHLSDDTRLVIIVVLYAFFAVLLSVLMHLFLKKHPGSKWRFYLR